MGSILGIVVTFVMVFGGFIAAGGSMIPILKAMPFELTMIGGAAAGSFMLGNIGHAAKHALASIKYAFKPPKWERKDYLDLLFLLFTLIKTVKTKGLIELEPHLDKPKESTYFKQYTKIVEDSFAIALICDTFRLMSMNLDNPHAAEDIFDARLEKHHFEGEEPSHALQGMADAMPALGIVAAVLGIIKTMSYVTEPPAVLGKMIGGALVGTFLGVFLAYCFIAPFASKLKNIILEEMYFYQVIKKVMVANLAGMPPQVSIEIGRYSIPGHMQPTFAEVEKHLQGTGGEAAK